MKRNLFLAAIASLMLLSCGEDRDDDNTQQNTISQKIVGTWTIVKKENNGANVPTSLPCTNLGNFVFGSDFKLSENHSSVVNSNCVTYSDNYAFSVDENNKKIATKNAQRDVLIYTISNCRIMS